MNTQGLTEKRAYFKTALITAMVMRRLNANGGVRVTAQQVPGGHRVVWYE